MKKVILKTTLALSLCMIFSVTAYAEYKLPAVPFETHWPDAQYILYPTIDEKNSVKSTLSLKDAYEAALPYAEDSIVAQPSTSWSIGTLSFKQLNARYGVTQEEYDYFWPCQSGTIYTLKVMEQRFDKDYPKYNESSADVQKQISDSRRAGQLARFGNSSPFYEETINAYADENKNGETFHLNMPIAEEYPQIVLDNIVYCKDKMLFTIVIYDRHVSAEPPIDIYNEKDGTTMGARVLRSRSETYTSKDIDNRDVVTIFEYYFDLYKPEDLENLRFCYSKAYADEYGKSK